MSTKYSLILDHNLDNVPLLSEDFLKVVSTILNIDPITTKSLLLETDSILKDSDDKNSLLRCQDILTSMGIKTKLINHEEQLEPKDSNNNSLNLNNTEETNESTDNTNTLLNNSTEATANISSSFTWQREDALGLVKKARRKRIIMDSLIAIIIALSTAMLFYYFFSQASIEEKYNAQENYIASIMKNIESEKKLIEATPTPTPNLQIKFLTSQEISPFYKLNSRFAVDGAKITSAEVDITTPPPSQPTDEELLSGTKSKPWIKKILVSNLIINQRENLTFIATGKSRVFIDYGQKQEQFLGEAVISGVYNKALREIVANISINRGYEKLPDGDQVKVEKTVENNFNYYISLPITAVFQANQQL